MASLDYVYILVASAILLAFVFLLWRTMLRRRALLLRDGVSAPPDDRAFNQIRIARAGARQLASMGHDVTGVSRRIDEAEERHRRGDSAGALALAERARSDLRGIQNAPPAYGGMVGRDGDRTSPTEAASTEEFPADPSSAATISEPRDDTPPATRPPPGLVQAKFTLSLLDQELAKARQERGTLPEVQEAGRLRDTAQAEFDQGKFLPAWQDALRARRKLGSTVEAVALRSSDPSAAAPSAVPTGTSDACGSCGKPLRHGDRFCRACGASVGARRCANCGAELLPGDGFCAACGAAVGT